ncbi:MAG: hypothetical protein V7640_1220 [Betaproteobacteria bacterium]
MQCTLLIPHLFWPGETAAPVTQNLELPQLTKLLARARCDPLPPITTEGWICEAFDVARQQDWPVAPLSLAYDGGNVGDGYWLRADPVHLNVTRDRLLLVDNSLFELRAEEAQSLVTTLNAYFAESGLLFHALHPKRWYTKLARAPAVSTHGISEVAGQDVRHHLPSGAEALAWHRLFNEIQMLLHEHPTNESREARGEPPVNSVWFWGGGTRPAVSARHFQRVWSDNVTAIAIGTAAGTHADALPADAETWLKSAAASASASHLITFDGLASAFAYRDSEAWRTSMMDLENRWLAPLLRALRANRVTCITLVALGEKHACRFVLRRSDLLKLWRRRRSLSSYA